MNNIEEKLWDYIDGRCTPEEQNAISALIDEDAGVRLQFEQMLSANTSFTAMELDEPSMAFTYNVMEAIRTENARVPLKAAINKRIIRGIGIFFTVTLLALLVLVITSVRWSAQGLSVNLTAGFKMPAINYSDAKIVVQAFVFFDVMLGLYLFDAYLRKKRAARSV